MAEFDFLNPLGNITPRFTEEQLYEIVEWFNENAKPLLVINEGPEASKVITINQLQSFLDLKKFHRRSFNYPSYAKIMTEVENLKMATHRMLLKEQFIYILDKCVMEPDMQHELKLAFRVFDTEMRDFLEVDVLREVLTTYGNAFNNTEIIEFLRDANVRGDGNVFYDEFVESQFTLAPELYKIQKEYLYEDADEDPSVPPLPEPEPEPELEAPPPPSLPPPPPPTKGKGAGAKGAPSTKGKKK